jgi:hypothetical protein
LPHEAWHVVQQREGRVPVTGSMGGTPVNTNPALETEADQMGAKAAQIKADAGNGGVSLKGTPSEAAQMKTEVKLFTQSVRWEGVENGALEKLNKAMNEARRVKDDEARESKVDEVAENYDTAIKGGKEAVVGNKMEAVLDWTDPLTGSSPDEDQNGLMMDLKLAHPNTKFIKGHLLNDHLGGLGIWENMFPITDAANKDHVNTMERHAKQYLLDAAQADKEQHGEKAKTKLKDGSENTARKVKYRVEAEPKTTDKKFAAEPDASFKCYAELMSGKVGKHRGGYVLESHEAIIWSKVERAEGQNAQLADIGWLAAGKGPGYDKGGEVEKYSIVSNPKYDSKKKATKNNRRYLTSNDEPKDESYISINQGDSFKAYNEGTEASPTSSITSAALGVLNASTNIGSLEEQKQFIQATIFKLQFALASLPSKAVLEKGDEVESKSFSGDGGTPLGTKLKKRFSKHIEKPSGGVDLVSKLGEKDKEYDDSPRRFFRDFKGK